VKGSFNVSLHLHFPHVVADVQVKFFGCPDQLQLQKMVYYQGCNANKKGVGTHQNNSHFETTSNSF